MEIRDRACLKSQQLYGGVHQITSNGMVYCYLVVGKEKALLMDTGWGTSDLRALVAAITDLPLTVLNTHGHMDHTYGNYQFDQVLIRDEDSPMIKNDYTPERRRNILTRYGTDCLPPDVTAERWVDMQPPSVGSLNAITSLDLGDRVLDIVHTPGHTDGSVCLIDRNEGLLFSGDSIVAGAILLHFEPCGDLARYLQSMKTLHTLQHRFRDILPGHHLAPLKTDIIGDIIDGAQQIADGLRTGEEAELFFHKGLRCDFGRFSIFYRR